MRNRSYCEVVIEHDWNLRWPFALGPRYLWKSRRFRSYQWALPEDTGSLEANLRSICNSDRDVVLFTSSRQLVHVMAMAQGLGLEEAFRASMQEMVVGSIGPVMSETLREYGIEPDFEPEHPRLGHLDPRSGGTVARSRVREAGLRRAFCLALSGAFEGSALQTDLRLNAACLQWEDRFHIPESLVLLAEPVDEE